MVTAPTRRTVVRNMTEHGLSERRALAVVGMSASSLRYTPAPDRNRALRARIVAFAHRHRRYGAGMIYLKLRQAGCSAPGFLDSGLTVFASMLPRPARRSHVAPERGFDSGTSLASTARCTSA